MRRAALVAALLALAPGSAWAHGGTTIASGKGQGYTFSVQAGDSFDDAGKPVVDLTAYPVLDGNGALDRHADVRLGIDGAAPVALNRVGDGYELLLPSARAAAWRDWTVVATVRGEAGSLTVRGTGARPTEPPSPGWILPGSVMLLVGAAASVLTARGRRRRTDHQPRSLST